MVDIQRLISVVDIPEAGAASTHIHVDAFIGPFTVAGLEVGTDAANGNHYENSGNTAYWNDYGDVDLLGGCGDVLSA